MAQYDFFVSFSLFFFVYVVFCLMYFKYQIMFCIACIFYCVGWLKKKNNKNCFLPNLSLKT